MAGTSAPVHALFENFEIWIFEFQKNPKFISEITPIFLYFHNSKKFDIK